MNEHQLIKLRRLIESAFPKNHQTGGIKYIESGIRKLEGHMLTTGVGIDNTHKYIKEYLENNQLEGYYQDCLNQLLRA